MAFQYDLISIDGFDFDSEAINVVAYDRQAREMLIQFHSGGTYVYEGVAESTYTLFIQADSLGGFYRTFIMGALTGRRDDSLTAESKEKDVNEDSAEVVGVGNANGPWVQINKDGSGHVIGGAFLNGSFQVSPDSFSISTTKVDAPAPSRFSFVVEVEAGSTDEAQALLNEGVFYVKSVTQHFD